MWKRRTWGQPPGSRLGKSLPHAGANARGVSLVLGVVNFLVSSRLGREAGLEIIGNPSIVPPGGLGAIVDERRTFLPAKEGSGTSRVPWPFWLLTVFPGRELD